MANSTEGRRKVGKMAARLGVIAAFLAIGTTVVAGTISHIEKNDRDKAGIRTELESVKVQVAQLGREHMDGSRHRGIGDRLSRSLNDMKDNLDKRMDEIEGNQREIRLRLLRVEEEQEKTNQKIDEVDKTIKQQNPKLDEILRELKKNER